MDTDEQHFDLDGPKIDNSVAMTLANDNIIDPMNGSNDPSFGAMDSLRGCNETAANFAPLDDIIKDLYDIKPPSPTVTYPAVSSTCHNQMPNYASPINNNVCLGNYINNEHYYIVPNLNDSMNNFPSSSGQHFLPSSQLSTESVPDTMVTMTTNLPVVNNLSTSTTMIRNILEEDNDPSPVYLDLSIDNMAPQVSNFTKFCSQVNTNNMGFQKQPASEDQNLRYMEYLDENGESAKIKYLDNTISSTTGVMKSFEAKTNNYSFQTNEVCNNNYLYAHSETIPREMGNNLIEDIYVNNNKMETIYENNNCEDLNKSDCVNIPVNDSIIHEETTAVNQTINSPEIIVCRPPLKTKHTIKAKSQPIYVETEENLPSNLHLKYFAALNEKNIKIPVIINRANSIKKKRKEKLKIRDLEDDFLFESINLPQEDNKSNEKENCKSSPPLPDTPCSSKRVSDLSEETFLRKRKRKNHVLTKENQDSSDSDSSNNSPGDTKSTEKVPKSMKSNESNDRDSYKIRSSKRIKKMYIPENECKSDSISTSSSESDDHSPIASKSKCPKCKKLFKTPRSLTIHKKRCSVGVENESDLEVTMAGYLESEKESDDDNDDDNDDNDNDDNDADNDDDNDNDDDGDDTDEGSLVSTKPSTTSVSAVENIEDIKETNIKKNSPKSDAVENCETIEIEQNPFRRCTRSQTNLNASTKQSCQNVEDVNETKPKGKRQTQSKEKADKAAPATRTRNLRRKKN